MMDDPMLDAINRLEATLRSGAAEAAHARFMRTSDALEVAVERLGALGDADGLNAVLAKLTPCPKCGGRGSVRNVGDNFTTTVEAAAAYEASHGGAPDRVTCRACGGTGVES